MAGGATPGCGISTRKGSQHLHKRARRWRPGLPKAIFQTSGFCGFRRCPPLLGQALPHLRLLLLGALASARPDIGNPISELLLRHRFRLTAIAQTPSGPTALGSALDTAAQKASLGGVACADVRAVPRVGAVPDPVCHEPAAAPVATAKQAPGRRHGAQEQWGSLAPCRASGRKSPSAWAQPRAICESLRSPRDLSARNGNSLVTPAPPLILGS